MKYIRKFPNTTIRDSVLNDTDFHIHILHIVDGIDGVFLLPGQSGLPPTEHGWNLLYTKDVAGTDTFTSPYQYSKYGLFIVGGGAGGAGDSSYADIPGNGGNGGVVFSTEIQPAAIPTFNITVGAGGTGGRKNSGSTDTTPGEASTVVVNGITTYQAAGGAQTHRHSEGALDHNPIVQNSALGGTSVKATSNNFDMSPRYHKGYDGTYYGVLGEDGMNNPFDASDTNLYGAAGGAGFNSYRYMNKSQYPNGFVGGNTGGGGGGYGNDNAATNKGRDATFYGCGGGGGAFCSNHSYSVGGNGYNGIVMIYGYCE